MKMVRTYPIQSVVFLALGIIFSFPPVLHAQVNQSELNKGQGGQIEFQSYTGQTPSAQVNTRDQIRNIGYPLGTAIRGGAPRSGANNRYYVIHAQSNTPEGDKIDADIIGLGPGAGVDHIRNLRLIIQGYLEGAYNYSTADAALLAEYITIYNAVFRGNRNYFNGVYKTVVMQYLTPAANIGLSTRYTEWPGRTLIVIPLGNSTAGSLSAIDTSSLSDPSVIDEMRRTDEDEGTGRRTAMADLKDREADEAEEAARRRRQAIAEEEAKIAAERAALIAERDRMSRAEAERRARELAEREAALAREREAAQQAEDFARQKRGEADQDRLAMAGEDQSSGSDGSGDGQDDSGSGDGSDGSGGGTDGSGDGSDSGQDGGDGSDGSGDGSDGSDGSQTAEDATDWSNWSADGDGSQTGQGSSQSGQTQQAGSDGSQASGQESVAAADSAQTGQEDGSDKDSSGDDQSQDAQSADDQSQKTAAENAQSAGDDEKGGIVVRQDGTSKGVIAMVIASRNSPLGYIVKVDANTGAEIQRSAFSNINIRTVTMINDKTLVALARETAGGTIHLVEVNTDTLQITKQSDEDMDGNSQLWIKGANYYTILSSGGNLYVGRFGADLTLQAQSSISIHPYAGINFQADMLILTQRDDGRVLLLDPMTLTEKQ